MSWRASAYVKDLRVHADGSPIAPLEKLLLFVLADSHNTDFDCAWISISKLAAASLVCEREAQYLIARCEERRTLRIERKAGEANRYFFPQMEEKGVHAMHRGGARHAPGGVHESMRGGGAPAYAPIPPITDKRKPLEPAAHPAASFPQFDPPPNDNPNFSQDQVTVPKQKTESQKRYAIIRALAARAEFLLRQAPRTNRGELAEILKGWAAHLKLEYFWPGPGHSPIEQAILIAEAKVSAGRP